MVELSLHYLERLNRMKKADYIDQLQTLVADYGKKLTVKQLRELIAKYAQR